MNAVSNWPSAQDGHWLPEVASVIRRRTPSRLVVVTLKAVDGLVSELEGLGASRVRAAPGAGLQSRLHLTELAARRSHPITDGCARPDAI